MRTDIWALAMTVYRLVHGAEWYNRALPPRTAVPDGGFADTLRWLAHVPKQWRRAIRAALNDDPQNRYQTATEFMNVLARLPTEPIWSCSTEPGRVFWERQTNQRVVKVEWIQRGPRRHDWSAWSEPRGVGRRMTLDGSKDLSHKEADRQLRNYFGATAVRC